MAAKNDKTSGSEPKPIVVMAEAGETEAQSMARVMVAPYLRHGILGHGIAAKAYGQVPGKADFNDFAVAIKARAQAVVNGDKSFPSEMLMAQAISLDTLFSELARRSAQNMGDYPHAAERYARLAFKAQANSRATLEALAKLHQPREQTVRHVHVNEGGQAVIADEFHHHTGVKENGITAEQPHAPDGSAAGQCPALSGPDPLGEGVPIASRKGQGALPNARRQGKRCA